MGKRYGLRRGELMVGALRDLGGWPWMTRSHAGKGREKGYEYHNNECMNK